MIINIHAHCDDHEAVLAVLEHLGLHTTSYTYQVESHEPEQDMTPPHGIERVPAWDRLDDVQEEGPLARGERMIRAREHHIAALVMWTREHIKTGPMTMVSDDQLRDAYRGLLVYGMDTDIQYDIALTDEQAQCVRGAFRDATAGMVPL